MTTFQILWGGEPARLEWWSYYLCVNDEDWQRRRRYRQKLIKARRLYSRQRHEQRHREFTPSAEFFEGIE